MINYTQIDFNSNLYKESLIVREEVLRKPINMVLRDKDILNDKNEYHFVAIDNHKVIACVLLKPIDNKTIELRQMSILDSHKGKNIGFNLALYAEKFAKENNYNLIIIRARKNVEGFYLKLNYISTPEEFQDEHTFRMKKQL